MLQSRPLVRKSFRTDWKQQPAYLIEALPMRPVTKISLLGVRLAIVALTVYWIAIFTGTHLPAVHDFSPRVNDKIKHFSAFFGLAMLMCYATTSEKLVKRFGIIALVAMAYAAFDELTQMLVPGRQADVMDFVADAAGVLTAISVYVLARYVTVMRNQRMQML
ncbi:VanZ like family protein [Rubripirellula tenax]|uniref:VanZ like family protein n=1 Tax=Rubripirellula tenax TaxID=2528015 RepID=A0A5C6FF16_9BACT|nr:VanZ family protein [Rubripirellula tenax]TWU59998.1 VanZ like family protein [Rubripirellula tenax]